MKGLPSIVRKTPYVFYGAAVLILLFGLAVPLQEISRMGYSLDVPVDPVTRKAAITQLIIRVGSDVLYMIANGLIIQVLIAIHDRLADKREKSAE